MAKKSIIKVIEARMKKYYEVLTETGSVEKAEMAVYGHLLTKPPMTYADWKNKQRG